MVEHGRFQQLLDQTKTSVIGLLMNNAASVDQASAIPAENLAAISEVGLYSMVVPTELGGLGLEPAQVRHVMRLLGGACGSTAFSFAQHHSLVGAVAKSENDELKQRWLAPLSADVLGGTAFAHIRRPGPPAIIATRTSNGWRLDGEAPWVTSWGNAKAFSVATISEAGELVWVLVPGVGSSLMVPSKPMQFMVLNATSTVRLRFDGVVVPESDVIAVQSYASWQSFDQRVSVRPNPLCLGIGDKALELLTQKGADTDGRFAERWSETVARSESASLLVDTQAGDVEQIAAARSECILVVQSLTTALLAAVSGLGATIEHPAQRLAREALFYVVQAQSAAGKAATLTALRGARSSR
ncbi:MAG: acyl-CoA/acyl-ACP dehydrogenase [Actinobacteria bacterium]|nr:acyl-CoA/acyl-ACP dehydrogenase [Actinomycetota bacterium]